MSDYQIITDATADLSAEWADRIGVAVIPMDVELDGSPYLFGPGGDITGSEFFTAMRQGKLGSTSQISPARYEAAFERYLSQGLDILYICFSSGLSGTIQAARICMDELRERYPERKLLCVDSLSASAGEGFLVTGAAEQKQAGLDIEALAAWVEANRLHVCHWFTVEDLKFLHRGGRVSAATAVVGSALQIKPVMHCDKEGHLTTTGKVRGRQPSLLALLDHADQSWPPGRGRKVFICHGDCLADAQFMAQEFQRRRPEAEITLFHMGPIIGAHCGPGVIAIFTWGTQR